MSQHTYRKVERTYQQNESGYMSSSRQMRNNPLGSLVSQRRQYEEEPGNNLHYELTYKSASYPGQLSFDELGKMKDVLLDLVDEFKMGNKRVIIDGQKKDSYQKRLLLLEHELNGLMKQKIMFEAPDRQGGSRKLDYAVLINEKQNQIVEYQKKIHNLEERLRRASQRQVELENEITFLNNKLKSKNSVIENVERQISEEVAYSKMMGDIISDIKSSAGGNTELSKLILRTSSTLDRNQIRAMSTKVSSSMRGNDFSSNEIMKLVRGLQSMSSKKATQEELEGFIEGWIFGLPSDSSLKRKILEGEERLKNQDRIKIMDEKFKYAGQIYKRQIQTLRKANPGIEIAYDDGIMGALRDSSSRISVNSSGILQIEKNVVKTVEVPVQDSRTKHLIYQFATEMKKIYSKYPKLYKEINPKLAEFFSEEIIDVISVDEVDRLVSIVKYEPQVVRVQNVYAYSSEKSRKIQFHLRVLLKALLTEMEKLVAKTGYVPEIDEGVVGLIKQEIMDVVDIDDILKVYRTVPKIVEVEKVIEKVVEKIVQVPRLVPTENRVEVPVPIRKVDVVENTVNVPVEVPKIETIYVEKLVEAPTIIEKVIEVPKIVQQNVEVVKEIPKILEVEKIVQKIVQVEKIEVVKEEVIVEVPDYRQIPVEIEKIVETQKIIEVIKPIQIYIDRVQEVIKQIPKVVQVERIKEVIVEKPIYYPAPEINQQVVVKEVPVDRIIQKIVPIIKVEDRIVEVPTIQEKIVEVRDIIKEPYPVQILRQKPLVQQEVKVVQVMVQKPVIQRQQVPKIVEKFIQVPVVHEKVRVETQIVKEPIIERVQSVVHKEVEVEKPVVLFQDKIVEVDKIINHVVVEPQVLNIVEEKIVPLETVVKEPIAVPTLVEKIVQKLVQVPKVIEIEKIVEKVVPVPRVVEKVVEVEKIVEKIVNKLVIEEKLKEVERIVEVPAFQEKIVEIQVPRNIYVENQVPVQVRNEFMVKDEIRVETAKVYEIEQPPKIVVETRQIPRDMMVEKIVPLSVPQTNVVFIDQKMVVPIEIQIPVDIEKEKFIPVEHTREQIVEVERARQKIVAVNVEPDPNIIEIQRYEERPYIEEKVKVVVEEKPYFQTELKEVRVIEQKIIPIVTEQEKLLKVTELVDRVIDRVVTDPKVYEVEKKVEKVVEKPKIVEIDKIVPHIVNVNSYIETIAEKIIDIPILYEKLKQIEREEEKIVQVQTTNTQIKEVNLQIQKAVIEEKLKHAIDKVHTVEEIMKVADKMIVKEADPVIITQDKIMEVPFIVQKIVEKIVVMPQIVQVLKYVHQITETEDLGVAVSADIGQKQIQYKTIAGNVRGELNKLLAQLKVLWNSHPQLRVQIEIIQRFLSQFEKLIMYPKIHEVLRHVEVQKEVEKTKVVPVPVGSGQQDLRMSLSKAILIEKLILELKRIKDENPRINLQLDEDIKLIFGSELGTVSGLAGNDFQKLIAQYSGSIQNKFKSMGGWSMDHQLMLNSFLEERFLMANIIRTANSDLAKSKTISEKRLEAMRKYKYEKDEMEKAYNMLGSFFPSMVEKSRSVLDPDEYRRATEWMSNFKAVFSFAHTLKGGEPTRVLDQLGESRWTSLLREKEQEIYRLKDQIRSLIGRHSSERDVQVVYKEVFRDGDHTECNSKIRMLELRIREYELRIKELQKNLRSIGSSSDSTDKGYLQKIRYLEREIERLEKENFGCEDIIRKLRIQITVLEKRLTEKNKSSRTLGSPENDSDRHQSSSSSSSSYGVNYMDYASIDDQANRGIGQIEGAHQVYKSTYAYGGGEGLGSGSGSGSGSGGYTHMVHSRGESGSGMGGGTSHRYQATISGGSGGEGVSYRSFEYSREGGSQRSSGIRGAYESSENYGQVERSSEMYQTSSRQIIKRTYGNEPK